jgi:hypothetical protein
VELHKVKNTGDTPAVIEVGNGQVRALQSNGKGSAGNLNEVKSALKRPDDGNSGAAAKSEKKTRFSFDEEAVKKTKEELAPNAADPENEVRSCREIGIYFSRPVFNFLLILVASVVWIIFGL